jgi:hypothetical protein
VGLGGSVHWKTYLLLQQKLPQEKEKGRRMKAQLLSKVCSQQNKNKALKKNKIGNTSLLPTCSGNLNKRRYLILPSLGLGSLH